MASGSTPADKQRMQALMAAGGSPAGNDIINLLRQFTSEPRLVAWPLSPDDYRDVAVVLRTVLSPTAGTGQDQYRVPTTHNLVIWGIRGHIAFDSPNAAGEAALTYGGGSIASVADLPAAIMQKAMLTRLDLQNQDRNEKLFEGRQLALSDILALCGGEKLDYSRAPHVVSGGQTVQLDATLKVFTPEDIGSAFEAGVILEATLVRCREG